MIHRGRIKGGVVVLDGGVRLPEGMAVLVSLVETTIEEKPIDRMFQAGSLDVAPGISDLLQALQDWYAGQCDGEWEHAYGIEIKSLDNPGWLVKVDLARTELQNRPFQPLEERLNVTGRPRDSLWLHCFVKDSIWRGSGDQTKLAMILRVFLDWACDADRTI